MAWTRKTLAECIAAVSGALESWLPGADARLARNNLGPTATAIGGVHHAYEERLARLARGRFVHLADEDELLDHGADLGIARKAAASATGLVVAVSTGAASIAIGAMMRRADGTRYRATTSGSIAGAGTFSVAVAALTAGTAGNTDAGTTLTALTDVTGEMTLTVDVDGLAGGAEIEEIETYRSRLLARLAYPPQAGTTSDYWRWATAVAGCSDCYVWPRPTAAGRVRLYPIFDGVRSHGLPTEADLDLVAEAVGASAPDGCIVEVVAFTPHPVAIEIAELSPSTLTVEDAIAAEIANIFAERSRVCGAAEAHPAFSMRATAFSFPVSWVSEAVSRAVGEQRHVLTCPGAIDGVIVLAAGERATVGNILFS
jgi:uncharacterized phage protein gp47/JayE